MPQDFTPELQDLLNGLLTKDPIKRLGHGGAKDIMVILLHKSESKEHEYSIETSVVR